MRLGMLAEKYFAEDPNTCLIKLRQLAEQLAQQVAARAGLYLSTDESQLELLRRLQADRILPYDVAQLFHSVRKAGNDANHAITGGHGEALTALKMCWQLGLWYHRTFKDADYKSGPFLPPTAPKDESAELHAELQRLANDLKVYQSAHQEAAQQLEVTSAALQQAKDDQAFWEQMAIEADNAKAALAQSLAAQQAAATAALSKEATQTLVAAATTAASHLHLDEAATRLLIDQQLREAGWEADTPELSYGKGVKPDTGLGFYAA